LPNKHGHQEEFFLPEEKIALIVANQKKRIALGGHVYWPNGTK
jgi:hypothetical protein